MTQNGQKLLEQEIITHAKYAVDMISQAQRLITLFVELSGPQDWSRLMESLSASNIIPKAPRSPRTKRKKRFVDGLQKSTLKGGKSYKFVKTSTLPKGMRLEFLWK